MDDLINNLTRQILQLFERFVDRARSVTAEDGPFSAAAVEKIRKDQQRLVQETDEVMNTFRTKVVEKERELKEILQSRPEHLAEQARAVMHKLSQIMEYLSLKDQAVQRWKEQKPSAIVAEYQEALSNGNVTMADLFETEAEWYLTQKGDPEATSRFLSLCAEFADARLTPAQKKAKAALTELKRIKQEATVVMAFFATAARVYDHSGCLSYQWRKEERHPLNTVDLLGVAAAIRVEGGPPVDMAIMDISKSGLRVGVPQQFSPETTLTLSLLFPGATEGSIYFEVQVRWCEEDPGKRGWYTLGLQVVEGTEGPWLDVFPKIVEQIEAYRALFLSPFNS